MIVKIQVIINVGPQKFNTVFLSYGAAWDLNFHVSFQVRPAFHLKDNNWGHVIQELIEID